MFGTVYRFNKVFIVFMGERSIELPVFGVAPVHESFIVLTGEQSINLPVFAAALLIELFDRLLTNLAYTWCCHLVVTHCRLPTKCAAVAG